MRRSLVFFVVPCIAAVLATSVLVCGGADRNEYPGAPHECRLWGVVSYKAPVAVVRSHLDSLELITWPWINDDGWGIGYFPNNQDPCQLKRPFVLRGTQYSVEDPEYDDAKVETAFRRPKGAVAHVRAATTGLTYVPDPHPFVRKRPNNGHRLLFAHNGTLSELDVLRNMISDEYFNADPPDYKDTHYTDPWGFNDSELFFMLILDRMRLASPGTSTEDVIIETVADIDTAMQNASAYSKMNFLMTDGDTMWAVRYSDYIPGNYGLFYQAGFNSDTTANPYYWIVASEEMDTLDNWVEIDNYRLITFIPGCRLVINVIPHL